MRDDLTARLRERATAFNDSGLRHGVADLLNEAADARAADAAEIADLKEWWKRSVRATQKREAERDTLAQQIAAVRALADEHWDWKAGLILAGRLRAILANGACLWRYDDGTEEYQPHEFSDDNGNCCNCQASPVTPESHVMALPPESAGRIAADVKATFWPAPVTPESETR